MNPVIYEQVMSLLGLIGLWALWNYLWKPLRVDAFRAKLFDMRSHLFDLASKGDLPFDDPAYTQLRYLINGTIRFAHRATFPTLVVAIVQSRNQPADPWATWNRNVQKLPKDVRQRLIDVRNEVSASFAKHILGGSVTLLLYVWSRVLFATVKASLLLLLGKRSLGNFTIAHARNKVEVETSQVAKSGVQVIEARVIRDEQRRTGAKRQHAYA